MTSTTKPIPEISSLANELKLIKNDLTNNWQQMTEEQIECLQEEMRDIQDYIKKLVKKNTQ